MPHLGCCLGQDLALLPQGDMTEVGEKGKRICFSLQSWFLFNSQGITVRILYWSAFSFSNVSSWVEGNEPEFLWRGPFTHGQICKKCLPNISGWCSRKYSVLLDDCLAAVDSHVGRHIFGESWRVNIIHSNLFWQLIRQCHWTEWIAFNQSTYPCNKQHIFC